MREVEAIWARGGIRIDWRTGTAATAPPPGLRILVVARGAARTTDEHSWPVAELLRTPEGRAIAVASVSAAERVVAVSGHAAEPSALANRRLGVVLGRAVAHEIGHFLLNTPGHASRGLMRARIGAPDLADLRDGAFLLDRDAALWAQSVLTQSAPDVVRMARFTYAR